MEWDAYLRFLAALVFVLALIASLTWAAKRFGLPGMAARPRTGRRLAVVETLPVDARHRLVLVRRDAVEHLLLLGGEGSRLIEGGIAAPPADFGADPPLLPPATDLTRQ
ncbi:MAG: FliO/MopB family protein [Inquilinus sp.]|nr:FliO/MopB family protein [Inquilinus sp.]